MIGYGNELRGDDGVGPCVARRVAGWGRPEVDGLAVHQLTPELAPALAGAEVVVFVDACVDDGGQKVCLAAAGSGPGAVMGHTSDPRWLLALAEALYGRRPEAWLVTIPAADFGLGGRLSATARAGMSVALRQINRLVCAATASWPPSLAANDARPVPLSRGSDNQQTNPRLTSTEKRS